MAGSFISGRIGANRSIEFMTILGGVIGVANGALLAGWLYFGGVTMAALYIPEIFLGLAQGLAMPYAQAGAMAVDTELAGSASGAVVFSQFFWPAALQQLTGMLADGTWVPMATVHFAAMTGALLAGWIWNGRRKATPWSYAKPAGIRRKTFIGQSLRNGYRLRRR